MSQSSPTSARVFSHAAIAVSVALVVALVAWMIAGGDTDARALGDVAASVDDASDPGSTDPDPGDPEPTDPEPTDPEPTDDLARAVQLESVLDDMIAFVEDERGLEFKERPVVQTQPEDKFVEQLLETQNEELVEEADELALFSRLYQMLGFLDDGVTIEDALESTGTDGVLGYYETENNELYIRGTEITPFVRSVIVHELVHALDDQHFELYRPEYDDRPDEIGFGLTALTEGNAKRIEDEYVSRYSEAEFEAFFAEQLGFSYDFSILTQEYLDLQLAPYIDGQRYVEEILRDGGQEELDETFVEPATTAEAVLHPERRNEPAIEVEPPEAGGEVLEEGVVGELFLEIMLGSAVGSSSAETAAEGWGGDWFVTWSDGDELCFRMVVVGDSERDTSELADAIESWADDKDADFDQTDGKPQLTVCG